MTLTIGSEVNCTVTSNSVAAGNIYPQVCGLTSSQAMAVVLEDDGDFQADMRALLLDVSGTTITPDTGSKTDLLTNTNISGSSENAAICRLSNTVALYLYRRPVSTNRNVEAFVLTAGSGSVTTAQTVLESVASASDSYQNGTSCWQLIPISSTQAVRLYAYGTGSNTTIIAARVLTVSGSGGSATVSQGTELQIYETAPDAGGTSVNADACPLSSTSIAIMYQDTDDGTATRYANVLTVSGSTVTAGTDFALTTGASSSRSFMSITNLTSAKLACWINADDDASDDLRLATVSGGSVTASTSNDIVGDSPTGDNSIWLAWASDYLVMFDGLATAGDNIYEFVSISGTTLPASNDSAAWSSTRQPSALSQMYGASTPQTIVRAISTSGELYCTIISSDVTPAPPAGAGFDAAAMRKPCSIEADGTYIYIAALDSGGTPVLIQFATALDADGSIVFDPGTGTDIGVECSATDPDTIWIAGEFGSTNTVERSTDGGGSFVVEDPGTFAPVTAFDVGPDTDERVIVAAETSGSIGLVNLFETVDGGDNWTEKNAGLSTPASVYAIGRFPTSPEEIVLGNANNATDRSDYSPNTGSDLDDITSGTPTYDATGVIVG